MWLSAATNAEMPLEEGWTPHISLTSWKQAALKHCICGIIDNASTNGGKDQGRKPRSAKGP